MMIGWPLLFTSAALLGTVHADAAQADRARAESNYAALARGETRPMDLTALELQEVAAIDREVPDAPRSARLSAVDRCKLAHLPKDHSPSRLELRALDLKCSAH